MYDSNNHNTTRIVFQFPLQTVSRKLKKERTRMERDAGRLETIADVGSAADFVRAARDAGGFGGCSSQRASSACIP